MTRNWVLGLICTAGAVVCGIGTAIAFDAHGLRPMLILNAIGVPCGIAFAVRFFNDAMRNGSRAL